MAFTKDQEKAAMEKLIVARIKMLFKTPFWGNIATRFVLEANDEWCKTAATDGRKIYFNPEFILKLTDGECIFLVGHEILHVIYDHIGRAQQANHNKQIFNIAADYCVNSTLVDEKLGDKITTVPLLYDVKYREWSYEAVYEDLMKEAQKNQQKMESLIKQILDEHLDEEGSGGEDEEGGDKDGKGKGKGRPKLNPSELREIQNEIKEAILSAAQSVGVGNVPGSLKRFVKDLTEPKVDWRQVLHQRAEAQLKSDFTWMKAGRRSWSCDAYLPGRKKDPVIEVDLSLDMSGSIGEAEIRDFFSEVAGIVAQFDSFKISVHCFDTETYNYQEFTEDNVDELMSYQPMGGGGTAFSCIFELFKNMERVPKQLVIFTDGEVHDWGDPEYCDTLFLIKNRREIQAPFGETYAYSKL